MNIGLIGYGVVGRAIDCTLRNFYNVFKYDKYQDLDDFSLLNNCPFVFIVVPTPFNFKKNQVDDSAIIESLNKLQDQSYEGIVIIKSTIPPGSCQQYSKDFNLRIIFNPEFLRESKTPNADFENQHIVVIGTPSNPIFEEVKEMYSQVLIPSAKYYKLSYLEAEMVKYCQNTMLGSRVALANMIYDACEEHGIDYNTVREIAFDSFDILGPNMVEVPGPDGKRGFGGKCLPKDMLGFLTIHNSDLLKRIIDYNYTLRDDLDK